MQLATGTNKVQTKCRECRVSRRHKEEGSGEIQRKAPMPEWEDATKGRGLWWNPKEAPMPEPEVRIGDKKGQRFEQIVKVGGN